MTVQEYLTNVPEDRIEGLTQLMDIVKTTFPKAQETMHYKMPTYVLDGHIICAVANQKSYLALYIMPHDLLENFKEELKPYNCGKSCIRLKKVAPEDLTILQKIVEFTGKNYQESIFYNKMKLNS